MAPSKSWMDLVNDRLSEAYEKGVQNFLNYAFKRTGQNNKIRCPCVKCNNTYSGTRELIETHLKVYGIVQNYTFWYHHGERFSESQSKSDSDNDNEGTREDESADEMHEIIRDLHPELNRNFENNTTTIREDLEDEPNDEAKSFYRLLKESHRTGSKPIHQVIWKKGGKVGQPPNLATIFFETRKNSDNLAGEDTIKQYDKIVNATQSGPSLSNIELVEECFEPQRHNHIICHVGGLKPNDLKTIGTKAELQAKLRETQKENDSLKNRMDKMEAEIRMIKEMFQRQHSNGSHGDFWDKDDEF